MKARFLSFALAALLALTGTAANAKPALVVDADSGRVLFAQEATQAWFPASLTKLMTTYVVLNAVKQGRVSLDSPLLYTERAREERPSKMGFPVGTIITVENALKLLIVKSANDLAVTLAEGVSGNVEDFVAEMNATAQKLGMNQSRFTNPNGWFHPDQVTTARDMALLAQAIYRDFPQSAMLYDARGVQLGKTLVRGHNSLLGRFEGADGMKTGFTCPSGFNLVATAKRGQRRLIAVVLGEENAKQRTQHAAELLEAGFGSWTFWRTGQELKSLRPVSGPAPNLRADICEKKKAPEAVGEVADEGQANLVGAGQSARSGLTMSYNNGTETKPLLLETPTPGPIMNAFLGPNPNGPPEFLALAAKLAPEPPPSNSAGPAVPMPRPRPAKLSSK
ncbi:D-alanyl-D-alanine carboxypeptidase family protein [Terrihabitans sp. B22-R8]|uniref:D-alanyl-D-alanine carboxypeptidase family protein n=1 Tax=Terrihabitans sp. B22-R8 TaxID=3425128 RepID=UPI00403D54E0